MGRYTEGFYSFWIMAHFTDGLIFRIGLRKILREG